MRRIVHGSKQVGALLQCFQQGKYIDRCFDLVAHFLEQALFANLREPTQQVVTQKVRKSLVLDGAHQVLPATLQRVQVGRRGHQRKHIVFQQIGGGQFKTACIECFKNGVSAEVIFNRDPNELQLPSQGVGNQACQRLANKPRLGQALAKPVETLPQQLVGFGQTSTSSVTKPRALPVLRVLYVIIR